jgi:hypothetical protein
VRDILPFEEEMGRHKEASILGHAHPENIIRMDRRPVLSIISSLKKMIGFSKEDDWTQVTRFSLTLVGFNSIALS